jgi:hypothetical protein
MDCNIKNHAKGQLSNNKHYTDKFNSYIDNGCRILEIGYWMPDTGFGIPDEVLMYCNQNLY